MIMGIGCDIVKVSRLEKWMQNKFILERFFHKDEITYVQSQHPKLAIQSLACRFAAKESFVKALGCGFRGISLKNICVTSDDLGKPVMKLYEDAKNALEKTMARRIHLSLSHEKEYAMAFVILEN